MPPPVIALAAAVAQRALTSDAPRPTLVRKAGATLIAVGSGGLAAAADLQFRRLGTTEDPFHPERASALVTTGPNAVTRNPMYVGMTGMLVANAVRRGSWRALLPVGAFVVIIDRLQIEVEEAALIANFGADYDNYRASVPRWLGPPATS